MKNCGLVPTLEQGKSVRSPPPQEKGVVETTCNEMTAKTSHSLFPCTAQLKEKNWD